MTGKLNAFVLAGNRKGSQSVYSANKALLSIKGFPLFLYVLAALDRVKQVDAIYLIGPRELLLEAIEKGKGTFRFKKSLKVIEQKETLLENLIHVFTCSLPGYREGLGLDPDVYLRNREEAALFVSADIPLLVPEEVEEFISKSPDSSDYCLGVTQEEALRPYWPKEGRPGIRMASFYIKGKAYRINNLHLARPFKIARVEYFQKIYEYRYQRRLLNLVRVGLGILGTRGAIKIFLFYVMAQLALLFSSLRLQSVARLFRSRLALGAIEQSGSEIFGTRFKMVETRFGGAALDVDNEESYDTIVEMFDAWRTYQEGLVGPARGG